MQGIKFNTQAIQAILDCRKTMTRRPIKFKNGFCNSDKFVMYALDHIEKSKRGAIQREIFDNELKLTKFTGEIIYPKYKIGETVFVKETFVIETAHFDEDGVFEYHDEPIVHYKADAKDLTWFDEWEDEVNVPWRPCTHMNKEIARVFLKITNIKVERLQDISEEDCIEDIRAMG